MAWHNSSYRNLVSTKIKDDTNTALGALVGLGFDPCKSTFTATPAVQFTSKSIEIKVDLNENNGLTLTKGISTNVAIDLASKLKLTILLEMLQIYL